MFVKLLDVFQRLFLIACLLILLRIRLVKLKVCVENRMVWIHRKLGGQEDCVQKKLVKLGLLNKLVYQGRTRIVTLTVVDVVIDRTLHTACKLARQLAISSRLSSGLRRLYSGLLLFVVFLLRLQLLLLVNVIYILLQHRKLPRDIALVGIVCEATPFVDRYQLQLLDFLLLNLSRDLDNHFFCLLQLCL